MATDKELSDFLRNVERRAFKRTVFAVRDDDAALDIVQDAMIKLVERYADRPADELPLLFQRILANATTDWFRRQKVRNAVMSNLSDFESPEAEAEDFDLLELIKSDQNESVESAQETVSRRERMAAIESALADLPARQREAFLLRYWEEFDVAEAASIMGCSEGSVKTHCSRAVAALAKALKERGLA